MNMTFQHKCITCYRQKATRLSLYFWEDEEIAKRNIQQLIVHTTNIQWQHIYHVFVRRCNNVVGHHFDHAGYKWQDKSVRCINKGWYVQRDWIFAAQSFYHWVCYSGWSLVAQEIIFVVAYFRTLMHFQHWCIFILLFLNF